MSYQRRKGRKTLIVIIIVVLLAAAAYALYAFGVVRPNAPQGQSALPPYVLPALTKAYTNSTYNFSLKMPENFDASEIPADPDSGGGETVVLQDAQGNGVQIVVSPFDEDTSGSYTLTKERILQDVPDMQITSEQPVEVGPQYTGLAFKSDNEAFDGASREVWFVFRGNLYQISTYERLDDLLKAIFGTWQFL
jgi:hypothetical protein